MTLKLFCFFPLRPLRPPRFYDRVLGSCVDRSGLFLSQPQHRRNHGRPQKATENSEREHRNIQERGIACLAQCDCAESR